MLSSNLHHQRSREPGESDEPDELDGVWSDPRGSPVFVEVKRTHNVRDVRGALLALAYQLLDAPDAVRAVCVVAQSRLSKQRLDAELERFRGLVRRDLGKRIALVRLEDLQHGRSAAASDDAAFASWITDRIARRTTRARASRQTVMSAMALLWLRGEEPISSKALQARCGASYPTVTAAIAEFSKRDLIESRTDRRVSLRYLPAEVWMQLARKLAETRTVHRYVDASGQARSPAALAARLFELQRRGAAGHVSVGGVLGAKTYFSDLDVAASPRLDLSVYGAGGLDFVRRLDAALEPASHARAKARVVVHVTPEPRSFVTQGDGGSWASEMECSADLVEFGLVRDAEEMFEALRGRRSERRGDDKR